MLSKVYIGYKNFDTALMIINKAISVFPDEGELYALRGYAHYKRNHHFRSIPDFKKAIELGVFSSTILANLGASLFAIKRYEEARDVLEQLLFPDTVDYKVCIYLGNIYNELGDPDKGIVFFNKSLELQEPSPLSMSSTYRGLQASYHKKGLYYKEIEMIKMRKEALSEEYYSPMYLMEIAEVYEIGIKNKQTALKYYEKLYEEIKSWYPEEGLNRIEIKINRLKEDIHFER
jgi:tetratricopeptide (TPR) repeat protein